MIELRDDEQAMLDGQYGTGAQIAMKIQVAIGDAYDAPHMVPATRTHVALSNQEADLWFAEKLVAGGAHCRVRPTVNPSFNWRQLKKVTTIRPEDEAIVKRTHRAYTDIGAIMTYDCTPYLERNVPRYREVISFSESIATPFVNSVYGARFGCPHLSIDQITTIAEMVRGRDLAVPLFAMTSALTFDLAREMGYLDQIEAAGGHIFSNTCMDQPCCEFLYGKRGVTESPKCAHYTKRRNTEFVITELRKPSPAR